MTPASWRRARVACLLLFALTLPGNAPAAAITSGYSVSPDPAWVGDEGYEMSHPDTYPAVFLLYSHQFRKELKPVEYQRIVSYINNAAGVADLSTLRIQFNPSFQSLRIHHIRIRRGNAVRDVTQRTPVRLIEREEDLAEGVQDGMMTAVMVLDDIRPGDVIDYAYSVVGTNPIFGNRYFGIAALDAEMPIQKLRVKIAVPPRNPVTVKAFKSDTTISETVSGNWRTYSYAADNVPAMLPEDGVPTWIPQFSWLEFSEYSQWKDVNAWAQNLYVVTDSKSREVEELHQEIRKQSRDQADYIIRALRFVQQNIRYLALAFGENSHRPRPPAETLASRYGDCKDKTALLVALLRSEGVKAWPVLVSTTLRRKVYDLLPSPGIFDHALVLVELEGSKYWLDGTRLFDGGSLQTMDPADFDVALPIGYPNPGLLSMYRYRDPPLYMDVDEDYFADDYKSPVRYVVKTRFLGRYANIQRYLFNTRPREEIQRQYLAVYGQYFAGIRTKDTLSMTDDPERNEVVVTESYEIPGFWDRDHDRLAAPFNLVSFEKAISAPKQLNRKLPFQLLSPRTLRVRTRLHFPADIFFKSEADPSPICRPAYCYTHSAYYLEKTYFHIAELTLIHDQVDPGEAEQLAKDYKSMREDWNFSILTGKSAESNLDLVNGLRKSFREASP